MTQAKRKPAVHVRARGDMWDWMVIGANGAEVCRSPHLYTTKANAKRGGTGFAGRYLKLRKVQVVELG
jgi:hypothetical protein